MTDPRDIEALCARAEKISWAIYLATDQVVADDVSACLRGASGTLRALAAENAELRDECVNLRGKAMAWESHASHVVEDSKALAAQLAAARADTERLDWLFGSDPICDAMGGVDLHEKACELAGGVEPTEEHYHAAGRAAIDAAKGDA